MDLEDKFGIFEVRCRLEGLGGSDCQEVLLLRREDREHDFRLVMIFQRRFCRL